MTSSNSSASGGKTRWGLAGVCGVIAVLFAVSVLLQVARDRTALPSMAGTRFLYIPSSEVMKRMTLSFDAVAADIYWIRALQYYGSTKLSPAEKKNYDLLYPLLDLTISLDPLFNVAYRFGAIFLAEAYPNGPGKPEQAVNLLESGIRAQPKKWQYYQDAGFVYYWWLHDYETAARWFTDASKVEGSPWWLKTLAATTLAQGGEREASKLLWTQLYESADDNEWLRNEAQRRLLQFRALDQLDGIFAAVEKYISARQAMPTAWNDLVAAGFLPATPVDPTGKPFVLDPVGRSISLSPESALFPLPAEPPPLPPPPASAATRSQ